MPFIDAAGDYPELQVRLDSATNFTLITPFAYQDGAATINVPAPWPTDFATVPRWLWGFLASYGKQTLPAILHDYCCDQAVKPTNPPDVQLSKRKAADDLFRRALRDQANAPGGDRSVSRVRATLFWAGVTFGRYQKFEIRKLFLISALALALSIGLYVAPVLLVTVLHTWVWAILAAIVPSLILGICAAIDSNSVGELIVVGAVAAIPVLALIAVNFAVTVALNVIPWVVPWIRSRLPGDWGVGAPPEVNPTKVGIHLG